MAGITSYNICFEHTEQAYCYLTNRAAIWVKFIMIKLLYWLMPNRRHILS